MKLFVPTIGSKLRLVSPWRAKIEKEYRNDSIFNLLELNDQESPTNLHLTQLLEAKSNIKATRGFYGYMTYEGSLDITLPKDTILNVDRIYIRKGAGEFDSITFEIFDCPIMEMKPKSKKGFRTGRLRFWVKLDNANEIEFEAES